MSIDPTQSEDRIDPTKSEIRGRLIKKGTAPKKFPPKADFSGKPPGANLPKSKSPSESEAR